MDFNATKVSETATEGQDLTKYPCKFCHICNAPNSTSYCSCQRIFYCKPAHAELDKSNHEPHCGPSLYRTVNGFKKKPGLTLLVASKNLLLGQVILKEYPLVCGPADNSVDTNKFPTCLGCCIRNKVSKRKRDPKLNTGIDKCSTCGWPVCSSACEKAYHHAANECRFFVENNVKYPSYSNMSALRNEYFLYKGILLLRTLLLKIRDPKSFEAFLKLPARGPSVEATIKLTKIHRKLMLRLLQDFKALPLLSTSDPLAAEEEISNILDRLCLYGFAKPISNKQNYYARSKGQVDAVYRCGSVIKRACNSNVTWDISDGPDFVLKLRATRFIKKNEELILPYSADLYLEDTQQRQDYVMKVIGAPCLCARCVDSTEFGSYFSAVKCPECKNGYLLPCNPVKKNSYLQCSLDDRCHYRIRHHKFYEIVNEIWKTSLKIIKSSGEGKTGLIPTSSAELKAHIKLLQADGFLHPNHSIIFRLVWEVVKRDVYCLPSLNWTELSEFISHCEYLGKIEETIGSYFSQSRAVLHFYMGRAFYQQHEMLKSGRARRLSRAATLDVMENVMNLYDEARKFFKSSGHEIERIIHEDMKTIVSIINKSKA